MELVKIWSQAPKVVIPPRGFKRETTSIVRIMILSKICSIQIRVDRNFCQFSIFFPEEKEVIGYESVCIS